MVIFSLAMTKTRTQITAGGAGVWGEVGRGRVCKMCWVEEGTRGGRWENGREKGEEGRL